jgi:flagellar hook-associated protein 3 FlgL
MELGPLLPGRIPGTLVADRLRSNIAAGQRELVRYQEQVATGKRFFLPSEDPGSAVRSISLMKLLDRKGQMLTNINADKATLSVTESALATVSDGLNKAKQLITAGIGDSVSAIERQGLATEAGTVLRQLINAGNTQFRGRYLFAGSENSQAPFAMLGENAVRYDGDGFSINSFIDIGLQQSNNTDGLAAFAALSPALGRDINPALSLSSRVSDLYGGGGVKLGQISIALSASPPTQTIDLSDAQTISDIKAKIEAAFPASAVTVAINAAKTGLQITPASGTVAVSDINGGFVAADLGIRSAAVATVTGGDLNPRMTAQTLLADLNGGTGIGTTAGNGLRIVNGNTTKDIDISAVTTVEGLLNLLRDPSLSLSAEISANGSGLDIRSRLNGANFSIGERNGNNATLLGIRTTVASTPLSELNFGRGVPVDGGVKLEIARRNGTAVSVDLAGAVTLQDVITRINAVDPGNLVASQVTVGNGLQLTDNSGTGALTVGKNEISSALALDGTEPGPVNTNALLGRDPNFKEATGGLNLITRLQDALTRSDNVELARLNKLIDAEIGRVNQVRGEMGGRLKTLDEIEGRLKDAEVDTRQALSNEYDANLAEVLTQITNFQSTFEATLRIAAQTMQLSLANYL